MEQLIQNALMKKSGRFLKCISVETQNSKSPVQRFFKNKRNSRPSRLNDSQILQKNHVELITKVSKYTNIFKNLQQKSVKQIKYGLNLKGHDCQIISSLLKTLFEFLKEENKNIKLSEFAKEEKNNQIKNLKRQILQYHQLVKKKNTQIHTLKSQRYKTTTCQDLSNDRFVSFNDSFSGSNNNKTSCNALKTITNKVQLGFSISKKLLQQTFKLNPLNQIDLIKGKRSSVKNEKENQSLYKIQRKSHFVSKKLQQLNSTLTNTKQLNSYIPQFRMTLPTQYSTDQPNQNLDLYNNSKNSSLHHKNSSSKHSQASTILQSKDLQNRDIVPSVQRQQQLLKSRTIYSLIKPLKMNNTMQSQNQASIFRKQKQ